MLTLRCCILTHTAGAELVREIIDHKKVVVLALNGPAVGAGAAWFSGLSDIVLAAKGAWLQVTFSALGLVPEMGSAVMFAQSVGVHRANEILMFGRRVSVEELMDWGLVNHIFPVDGFHDKVISYLEEQLSVNDGKSMMEVKRLQNCQIRDQRITALANAVDALAERFVEDAPTKRFEAKRAELEAKSKAKDSKL
jgi:peroxisomal 3,2-trans-enoyl-CoA isomerase